MSDDYRDPKTGRFLHPPPNAKMITSENASSLAKKRQEIYRKKAAKAILDEAKSMYPNMNVPSDVWGLMMANLFVKVMEAQYPSAKDVYKIGQMLGALPKVGEVKLQNESEPKNEDILEQADRILSIIERAKKLADNDRGEIIDATPTE